VARDGQAGRPDRAAEGIDGRRWCQACKGWTDHTSIGHAEWNRDQQRAAAIPESRQTRDHYDGYERHGDPPNHDHALSQMLLAHGENPNTISHLAGMIAAHTYAALSVRDKLDELCALLRWHYKKEEPGGNTAVAGSPGTDAADRLKDAAGFGGNQAGGIRRHDEASRVNGSGIA
jgi:hypothetical protein